ncbi:ankyrin repeat domain-containing protein [Kitasatospora sp. SUK 42]|uniref:ankyrin repeat domain-containing protein n=1 Tax=Kitasatospora sp. SUK 42 TaxID=1588882 RepID=UPI001C319A1E|nr:ankyrin repeat domain-containing protein [Kitasatospora sp. SUK 42]MBV2155601.1 ankyrin repeat domain-containing protein [Kitasatospora sp. SUK 42]
MTGWTGVTWDSWRDADEIRARLDAGADPEDWGFGQRPLHRATKYGSPEVVAELARRVTDVDALEDGTTALWEAVVSDRPGNARALVAAGADPWRPQLGGWSPGRLALAGPVPDLFPVPDGEPGLTAAEQAAARQARQLVADLGDFHYDNTGLACIAGIDAAEAIRRLDGTPVDGEFMADFLDDPYEHDLDDRLLLVGVTTVPGGCVVTQPWGYTPSTPGVMTRLTAGTVGYGIYANPKSGNQGRIVRDGTEEGSGLHPGGGPLPGHTHEEVFTHYLYHRRAIAYACAFAGLRPVDARAVTGPADFWIRVPDLDYWKR